MNKVNLYELHVENKEPERKSWWLEDTTSTSAADAKRRIDAALAEIEANITSTSRQSQDTKAADVSWIASSIPCVPTVWTDEPWTVKDVKHMPTTVEESPKYLYNEDRYIDEAMKHIDSTYKSHYSGDTQPTELIIDSGNGAGFCIGNIIKYAARFGKKDGTNRKDLLKIIHYAVMMLHVIDKERT